MKMVRNLKDKIKHGIKVYRYKNKSLADGLNIFSHKIKLVK